LNLRHSTSACYTSHMLGTAVLFRIIIYHCSSLYFSFISTTFSATGVAASRASLISPWIQSTASDDWGLPYGRPTAYAKISRHCWTNSENTWDTRITALFRLQDLVSMMTVSKPRLVMCLYNGERTSSSVEEYRERSTVCPSVYSTLTLSLSKATTLKASAPPNPSSTSKTSSKKNAALSAADPTTESPPSSRTPRPGLHGPTK
jgi:hypothetical protein